MTTINIKHFLTNKFGLFLFYMMKNVYLCSVEIKIETGALASQNFVSGLRDFTACPERKKSVGKSTKRVNQPQTTNLRFFITFDGSAP